MNMTKIKSFFKKNKPSVFDLIIFIALTLFSLSLIVLLSWALFTSLKDVGEYRTNKLGLPKGNIWQWAFGNYKKVFEHCSVVVSYDKGGSAEIGVGMQIINSLIFCVGSSFMGTFVSSVMAYAAAKFEYKFSKVIYAIVVITISLPIVGAYPSEIQVLKQLGIFDTYFGILIQRAHFLSIYFLVFFANFKMVPKAFSEAAYVDGASELRTMFQINYPMILNTAFTIFLLQFIVCWNDYQTMILYMPTHPTLALAIFRLGTSYANVLTTEPMRMAGCFVLVIPILAVFIIFRNKIMGNLSMGGLKE